MIVALLDFSIDAGDLNCCLDRRLLRMFTVKTQTSGKLLELAVGAAQELPNAKPDGRAFLVEFVVFNRGQVANKRHAKQGGDAEKNDCLHEFLFCSDGGVMRSRKNSFAGSTESRSGDHLDASVFNRGV